MSRPRKCYNIDICDENTDSCEERGIDMNSDDIGSVGEGDIDVGDVDMNTSNADTVGERERD